MLAEATEGDADAQNNLGSCYLSGEGVKQDYEKAVVWFTLAAEQGHADAQARLRNLIDQLGYVPELSSDREVISFEAGKQPVPTRTSASQAGTQVQLTTKY